MDVDDLTQWQIDSFTIVERVCSVFSLLGCVLIIGTFCTSKAFHKPINRLVFYASFGNLMTNVATLMADSFIGDTTSAGCQFQAFLVQMFMPADALWTLAMAVNVYLTFYYKFDAPRLRQMEIPYLFLCYGIPFVPALVFLFVQTPDKGRMYGNAILWCWISGNWDIFRIATFYGPVWVVILVTFFIYIRAGTEIYKKHKQLRDFSSHHDPEPSTPMDDLFSSSKTTEVHVTTEVIDSKAIDLAPLGRSGSGAKPENAPAPPSAAYSVQITSDKWGSNRRSSQADISLPIQSNRTNVVTLPPTPGRAAPPSALNPPRRKAAYEANNAAWSYTKCAILFFTALLVTWIPSSANRVFSVVHVDEVSIPLEYMSALVLPLQGFWNAAIYVVTSWKACKTLAADIFQPERRPSGGGGIVGAGGGGGGFIGSFRGEGNFHMMSSRSGSKNNSDSESMTELATNQPPASDERSDSHASAKG